MKITLLNIANKMPTWVIEACNEYLKRINYGKYSCNIIEIKSAKTKTVIENMQIEAKKFEQIIPKNSFIIILDEKGKNFTSTQFAEYLDKTSLNFSHITFIIGGADGIDREFKNKANEIISLSSLVFPHTLVRIILLEQIYRAISILENHPYHRD